MQRNVMSEQKKDRKSLLRVDYQSEFKPHLQSKSFKNSQWLLLVLDRIWFTEGG